MKPFWLFILTAPSLYACAGGPPPQLQAANDAARLLCESAPPAVREAAFRGVSVEDLCAVREVIEPFVAQSLAAQDAACKAALPTEAQ